VQVAVPESRKSTVAHFTSNVTLYGAFVVQHEDCLVPADWCNPVQDTLLTSFVSGSSYHCMSGQVADHCFDFVVPTTRKSDTAHSFLRGPSSQSSAGRDKHFSSSLSAVDECTLANLFVSYG
jgi:hypothetical protein